MSWNEKTNGAINNNSANPVPVAPPVSNPVATTVTSVITLPPGDKILDVSSFQPNVDWASVKAAGYVGAIIKAGEGVSIRDSRFSAHYAGAKAVGMKVGAYFFFHAKSDPMAQVENFDSIIKPTQLDLPLFLDVEWDDGLQALGNPGAIAALKFLEQFKNIGVYTAPGFFTGIDSTLLQQFAKYPLWVAHYGVPKPKIPAPWSKFYAWQFSSNTMVPGIGDCDVSVIG